MPLRDGSLRFTSESIENIPAGYRRGVRLVAHGQAGHGSRPRLDNAVAHLAAAVAKLAANQPPMRLNDITRTYFERLATVSSPEEADR